MVMDMDVDWVDADDGAILLVKLFDLPNVFKSVRVYFVEELVPER